jgi:hypothetical protein
METMTENLTSIEDSLTNLFKEMVQSLTSERASVSIRRAPQIQHEGVSVSLTPTSSTAAPIVADARNGFSIVSLVAGRSTLIEVVQGDGKPVLDEVRSICRAIVDGYFQEDMTLVGSEITKCVGTIDVEGQKRVFRYFGRVFPFRKKKRMQIAYSPY